ncbi:DUF5805 domain-containing protein [Halobacteriaceae archaeon SHR40]|uniref:DUF5805 domain-containing protein n=1 Tax=Halovenus amylolytica TaxID=2500550 RepID=UPI000FE43F43
MTDDDIQPVTVYPSSEESEIWKEEANDMGMTYSEYYRMMINAGRREFAFVEAAADAEDTTNRLLEERVIDVLDAEEPKNFEDVVEEVVTTHYKERIAEVLRDDDRATYRPRDGGYVLDPQ